MKYKSEKFWRSVNAYLNEIHNGKNTTENTQQLAIESKTWAISAGRMNTVQYGLKR